MYGLGEGVEQSDQEMLKWLKLVAENGDDFAQDILSRMYFEGAAVEKSLSESLKSVTKIVCYKSATENVESKQRVQCLLHNPKIPAPQ